jgi:hypothetical protein
LTLANIGGLLLLMTVCALIVELVFAVRGGKGPDRSIPARPDLGRN